MSHTVHWLQGAQNVEVLTKDIAPAYAAAIESSCKQKGANATDIYRLGDAMYQNLLHPIMLKVFQEFLF